MRMATQAPIALSIGARPIDVDESHRKPLHRRSELCDMR
jgi:hypothetical protein